MTDANQHSKALRLADELENAAGDYFAFHKKLGYGASAELRRLHAMNQELLASLSRLSFAAMCRDNTSGDPCRLIEVKAELQAANKQASDLISKVGKLT